MLGDEILDGVPALVNYLPVIRVHQWNGAGIRQIVDWFVTDFRPEDWESVQYVLIVLGAHDLLYYDIDKTILKYRTLVNIIRARLGDVHIVALTVPPRIGLLYQTGIDFNKELVCLAKKLKIESYPLHNAFVHGRTAKAEYFDDGVRCSEKGLKVIVKVIKAFKSKLYL